MQELKGDIQRITFHNSDTGYSVLRLKVKGMTQLQTVVGTLPPLHEGETVLFTGEWIEHPKFGRQLQAKSCQTYTPESENGIIRFLSSGIFSGVGPKTAERIVAHFGSETLNILENTPKRIREIPGFGQKKCAAFLESWEENSQSRKVMIWLNEFEIPPGTAMRIFKRFGNNTRPMIEENPWVLAREIYGIGFRRADQIAAKMGFAANSAYRIEAGLEYTLQQASAEGHVFLPRIELLRRTAALLQLNPHGDDAPLLPDTLGHLVSSGRVELHDEDCYLPRMYQYELKSAEWISSRAALSHPLKNNNLQHHLQSFESKFGLKYSEEQSRCIISAVESTVFILTGGPGTGKTTTLRGILHLLDKRKENTLLAAPTGRAARRMGEVCGKEARTLHRLLEYSPAEHMFLRNEENPLEADRVIVDEMSMVDISLFYALIKAMPPRASLILIGDADQLPSVGPGNVLRDLLSCPEIQSVRLQTIYRQAAASAITVNAHKINHGEMPDNAPEADFHMIQPRGDQSPGELIAQLVTQEIPRDLPDLNPREDIQVLTPMKQGPAGTLELNRVLQDACNPHGTERSFFGIPFRVGDRIMQTRNNYELGIFNGDTGFILHFDKREKETVVDFEGRPLRIPWNDMDQLLPAWAMTIHKSQGSEYPAVVLLLDSAHHIMLQRNLLYTAVTRAKRKVWLVSHPRNILTAVRTHKIHRRYTRLTQRISGGQEHADEQNEFLQFLNEAEQR